MGLISIAAYDLRAVHQMLRDWTPERLREELAAGRFGGALEAEEAAELRDHLTAWMRRALGAMPLRDALLVDRHRGARVFSLLCVAHTVGRAPVPAELAALLPPAPATVERLPAGRVGADGAGALAERAAAEGLALAVLAARDDYPFPESLLALVPDVPPPYRRPGAHFEQPTGWRRRIAALLAAGGVALLTLPLLLGHIPDRPAGLPLALLTLALLGGIRGGPAGFAGSLCIWLVAKLPRFRYGST
ncbi:MAG TPA: hypothetical protein PKD53_25540, partial [Chloroflexaceae bacterium]|nr:hypothetical protein [Chloroflexaceae bacterium]